MGKDSESSSAGGIFTSFYSFLSFKSYFSTIIIVVVVFSILAFPHFDQKINKIIESHRDPIYDSAFELQSRLYNIVENGYFKKYVFNKPETDRERRLTIAETLHSTGRFFCNREIIRKYTRFVEVQTITSLELPIPNWMKQILKLPFFSSFSLDYKLSEHTTKFYDYVHNITAAMGGNFCIDSDYNFRIRAGERHSIGELLIRERELAPHSKDTLLLAPFGCDAFSDFYDKFYNHHNFVNIDDISDQYHPAPSSMLNNEVGVTRIFSWFYNLRNQLLSLPEEPFDENNLLKKEYCRIAYLQNALLDLAIEFENTNDKHVQAKHIEIPEHCYHQCPGIYKKTIKINDLKKTPKSDL